MASSSSASSVISYESESSREPTPEYDPIAAYEARAPLHWDEEEWDFRYQSEDDESLTDGEDLALLLGAELEDDEDDTSWGEDLSSSERADSFSSEEDPMAGTFLLSGSSDDSSDSSEGAEGDDSFTSNDSGDDDDSGSDTGDSGPSIAPSPKRRKTSGVYWW
ncbi:hypothetical protein GQ55_9G527700 [Panicum hallii var. hallii]|uniref:Uncharacterized protein n=1 Tax=Panicum hallii var. hallii TaxID=1504633 RepID=A0A2T7CEI7_9POAL|nr:hypothetical protein GQ55_9G527700 [Panicum hallii var. hallii]